jgi:carbamoyl-phosphate synthase small subunit
VEGLRARDIQAFSVQYHPEAAAGPHDASYLFDRFVELLEGKARRVSIASGSERGAERASHERSREERREE